MGALTLLFLYVIRIRRENPSPAVEFIRDGFGGGHGGRIGGGGGVDGGGGGAEN